MTMDRETRRALEQAKAEAQHLADVEGKPMAVAEVNGTLENIGNFEVFTLVECEAIHYTPLYTAYPSIDEEKAIMDRKARRILEETKLKAQVLADDNERPVSVIENEGSFAITQGEGQPGESVLYTAYPTIYEELSSCASVSYNGHEVRFLSIRHFPEDDMVTETTRDIWDIAHAKKVQAFLNKVLQEGN